MATRTIYLVRHGHYEEWKNDDLPLEGHLTGYGIDQARLTARALKSNPITAIYTSNLNRAVETGEIIKDEFPLVSFEEDELLQECVPVIPDEWAEFFKDYPHEKLSVDKARADKAFEKYFQTAVDDNQQEIIVAHGNLIRYLLCRVLEVDGGSWSGFYSDNCGITKVIILSNGWRRLISYNDTSHLPKRLVGTIPHGGLSDTLLQAAQEAETRGDKELAHNLAQNANSILYSLESEKTFAVEEWLKRLKAG